MPPTVCTVTGLCRGADGNVLAGVTISAAMIKPFIHSADDSLILNYQNSTVSAADGTWSLELVETETDEVSMTITFYYPLGSATGNERKDYTIIVPDAASATFASLIGSQL